MGNLFDGGGGGGDWPAPLGNKMFVEVGSLEELATQIQDDLDAFHREIGPWSETGRSANPMNAQFFSGPTFQEAAEVYGRNFEVYQQVRALVVLLELGLGALASGARNLADVYPGVDGFNNVELGVVEGMFPEIGLRSLADIGDGEPPGEGWTVSDDRTGWDTDGDGQANIVFGPSGAPPPTRGDDSVHDRPDPVAADTHEGYEDPIDTLSGDPENGGLDSATFDDLSRVMAHGNADIPVAWWAQDGRDAVSEWTEETVVDPIRERLRPFPLGSTD
jgi:hypothetical protein